MFRLLLVLFSLVSGQDPEIRMTVPEIIARWGYPVETHSVTTEDGYVLTLHRIPHGRNETEKSTKRVVFLQHGLLASSSTWITNLPHLSLGFILADAGFDVWMGNSRGNIYSKSHTTVSEESNEFWQFSWQEMAEYDLQASIDYVLKETDRKELDYVGHSQGTLIMFSKLAEDEKFNEKIRQFHALAPVVSVGYVQGALKRLAWLGADTWVELGNLAVHLRGNSLLTDMLKGPCYDPDATDVCLRLLVNINGPSTNQLNISRVPVFLSDYPAGTSNQNLIHWLQMLRTGLHRKYDHGFWRNIDVYGSVHPPTYDISKIRTDMYLYWSDFDALANLKDITKYLLPRLPKEYVKGNYRLDGFNHADFVWGDLAAETVYEPMIRILKAPSQ